MDVLNEFQNAIEIERQKRIEEYDKQDRLPLNERVAKGVTIPNVKVKFDFYEDLPNPWCSTLPSNERYIFSANIYCKNNISKFKEGSPVILSNGTYHFEMNVEEDSPENFTLRPNDFNVKYCNIDFRDYPKNNWEINTVKTNIGTKLLLTIAELLENNNTILNKIENLLNGLTTNSFSNNSEYVPHLDESQNTSYSKAINSSDFCLIQGPPGTGKTETIANITKHFVDKGLKVFITAPTHTAINNCIDAISKRIKDSNKVIKIGEKAQNKDIQNNKNITKKTRLQYSSYLSSSVFSQNGIAIGATPYSLCYPASKRLNNWEFDVVIIDEAAQLSIPLSIAALCKSDKYIFVGDHKQLDPIVPKNSNNEMFKESAFERLARIYPDEVNLLNISYRLNTELIKIPNTLFYRDLLYSDSTTSIDKKRYNCQKYSQILNNNSHILVTHNVFDSQGRSPFEAKFVSEIVSEFLNNGINFNNIGIMSPYRAQVREIKKELKNCISDYNSTFFDNLFVDTVDSIQGQEREYIIYSMSNSNPLESKRRLDFFYSPNRLNVAITRAIKKCIVIANYKIFDINEDELVINDEYEEIRDNLEIFKQYHSLSTKVQIEENVNEEW